MSSTRGRSQSGRLSSLLSGVGINGSAVKYNTVDTRESLQWSASAYGRRVNYRAGDERNGGLPTQGGFAAMRSNSTPLARPSSGNPRLRPSLSAGDRLRYERPSTAAPA
eukprot:9471558-Pyramimonas_sp.AAC.1